MKFKVNSKDFLNDLGPVLDTVPSVATYPVLTNFLLIADKNGLTAYGTDLDNSVMARIPATIEDVGSCAISAKIVKSVLKEIDEEITFERIENQVVISYKNGKFKLGLYERDEFPELPSEIPGTIVELNMEFLRASIEKTVFCVSSEPSRMALSGLYWEYGDGKSTMVGSDGFRMGIYTEDMEINLEPFSIIIPPKILNEVLRLGKDNVKFGWDKTKVFFQLGNYTLISRLIDDRFPDYKSVIPEDNPNVLKIKKEVLSSVLRRVSVFSPDKAKSVELILGGDTMEITARSELGSGTEKLSGEYTGSDLRIGMSASSLLEFLRKIEGDIVEISFGDSESPVLIKDPANHRVLYVVTPIILRE